MRRPLHLLSLISHLLLLAAAGMWARSYWRGDKADYMNVWTCVTDAGDRFSILCGVSAESGRGGLAVRLMDQSPPDEPRAKVVNTWRIRTCRSTKAPEYPSLTFGKGRTVEVMGLWLDFVDDNRKPVGMRGVSLCLPYAAICLPAAFLPARWVLVRRARRWRAGEVGVLCGGCGYDLRSSPDPASPAVGRCPECGRVQPAASVVAGGRA